jgi:hypothetical protein
MIVALVCMTVSAVLIGSLLRLAVVDRRQVRTDQHRLQADWLAESAIGRAVYQLSNNPEYAGEQWDIPAAELGGRHAGRVEINVASPEDDEGRRVVTAAAVYPTDATLFAKRTKTITLTVDPNP